MWSASPRSPLHTQPSEQGATEIPEKKTEAWEPSSLNCKPEDPQNGSDMKA